jgi:hypothetical protein
MTQRTLTPAELRRTLRESPRVLSCGREGRVITREQADGIWWVLAKEATRMCTDKKRWSGGEHSEICPCGLQRAWSAWMNAQNWDEVME